MSATIIESILADKLDPDLLIKWINNDSLENVSEDCELLCYSRSEFVTHFLYYLRSQTDSILQTNSSALQVLQHSGTPEKLLSSRKHQRSISDPTFEADRSTDKLSVKEKQRSHESPNREKKRAGRKVKTKLFSEEKSRESISSDDSRLNTSFDRIAISSTPMKNGLKASEYPNLPLASPVTPLSKSNERCDTPRASHRHSRSQDKTCLGDYLASAQKSTKKKRVSKNASDDSEIKTDLDLSNSDVFPVVGARKSNSLRSDKRRIKPTNIDRSKKSLSLNSFNSESFQQPSPLALEDNLAFKQQKLQPKELSNSFDAERNILKQERHKLMEKFNILNTESPKPSVMPQIKITQKESIEKNQNFVCAEPTKVVYKEKIDILIEIYDALLKNNLILSMNTEIYFLISILLSKQYEDDYNSSESKLNDNNNLKNYLLKIIHNSTYFAVKSLWQQKAVLEIILDKNSLKLLGENKKVRSFYPELAKFLLNSYGLKCEAEGNVDRRSVSEPRSSNGVICFNQETDNAENFPSLMSFQNFKKQRDMFYEILRWYNDSQPTVSRTALKARVKALLAVATAPANHAHLAALLVAHMLAHCQPQEDGAQESRLSKLQRRLTRPACAQPAASDFQPHEMFYKDLLECADSDSFRAHARDALAAQLCALDAHALADDRATKAGAEVRSEYLSRCRRLRALARLLALLAALPYAAPHPHPAAAPPHRVLEAAAAVRAHTQPTIDLKGILIEANQNGHLIVTIPWLVQYLSILDYTSLRITYYQQLLKIIFEIYANKLKITENSLKKNTVIFLKTILGSLFSLPHFPQELFYEKNYSVTSDKYLNNSVGVASEVNQSIDNLDLIDEGVLFELCPNLKEVNSLLLTCKVGQDQKGMGSFRHITPVSLTLNTEEKMRNKERELQARLEEEFLKSQPASTRRTLEMVSERCLAAAVRQLAKERSNSRTSAYNAARECMKAAGSNTDQTALLQAMESAYTDHLHRSRQLSLETVAAGSRQRARAALAALLPLAPAQAPLAAIACTNVATRLQKWMDTHWSVSALNTDIQSEMRSLVALGEAAGPAPPAPACPAAAPAPAPAAAAAAPASAAAAIIDLKEQACLILEGASTPLLADTLARAASCSARSPASRAPTRRALLQLSLDLCLITASKRPKDITEEFLNQLHAIWDTCCPDRRRWSPDPEELVVRRPDLSPEMRNFVDEDWAPSPVSDEEQEPNQTSNKPQKIIIAPIQISTQEKQKPLHSPTNLKPSNPKNFSNLRITISSNNSSSIKSPITPNDVTIIDDSGLLEYFDRVLCPRNVVLLSKGDDQRATWDAVARILVFLLRNDYLSEDSLTEQCLAVYRQDWPQPTLEHLSQCMRAVSGAWRSSLGKFTLFLDFLAEYCGDMDLEPVGDIA